MKIRHINEEFVCQRCGSTVGPHPTSCRNHCPHCLYSLHVDETLPGDRASQCHGLMYPHTVTQSGKKGWLIIHHCSQCDKEITNKTAPDDDMEALLRIMNSQSYDL